MTAMTCTETKLKSGSGEKDFGFTFLPGIFFWLMKDRRHQVRILLCGRDDKRRKDESEILRFLFLLYYIKVFCNAQIFQIRYIGKLLRITETSWQP